MYFLPCPMSGMYLRYTSRFFEHVGHETSYSLGEKSIFFNKSCHCQPYQYHEQSRQKLGTFLEHKSKNILIKVVLLVKYSSQKNHKQSVAEK